jgi:transcription antitermination factor NusG
MQSKRLCKTDSDWEWDSMSGSFAVFPAGEQCLSAPPPSIPAEQWFAVQTRYRREKKVAAQLERKGCEVYLPLLTECHQWSDRHKNVSGPLFPGYAFVHLQSYRDARTRVLQTVGLVGFVNFGGIVTPVPEKQIEDLRLLLRQDGIISIHPFMKAGQRVRVRTGCLQGLEGTVLQHDRGKLLISIEAIQRSVAIEIQGYELELA